LKVDFISNIKTIIAIDSTGIKITNRGQWMMDDKWSVRNKKKGYLKIHVAINIKTKEILALDVTDGKVHDAMIMKKLVRHVLNDEKKKKKRREGSN
jgi:Transposase DDE domain